MGWLFRIVSGLLLIAVIVLAVKVLFFEKDVEHKPFAVHLKTLGKAAKQMKAGCYAHREKARKYTSAGSDTAASRVDATMDTIMSFADSADYYFSRLVSLKGDAREAESCFHQYGQFSGRVAKAISIGLGNDHPAKNYLLAIEERLPAGKLSFESEQEVELLALLLEIEFYESIQRSLGELASFCENW